MTNTTQNETSKILLLLTYGKARVDLLEDFLTYMTMIESSVPGLRLYDVLKANIIDAYEIESAALTLVRELPVADLFTETEGN